MENKDVKKNTDNGDEAGKFKAFDFAQEVVKQVIALSTGIVALTVTFHKDVIGENQMLLPAKIILIVSWLSFLISIWYGIKTLMGLTGAIISSRTPTAKHVTKPAKRHIFFFFSGLMLTVLFGIVVLVFERPKILIKEPNQLKAKEEVLK